MLIRSGTSAKTRIPAAFAALAIALALGTPAWQAALSRLPATAPQENAGHRTVQPRQAVMHFEPNYGQVDPGVRFIARAGAAAFYFKPSEVDMALPSGGANTTGAEQPSIGLVRLQFIGASDAALSTTKPQASRVSYITGDNSAGWHTGIPTYGALDYANLYSGVDLRYEGTTGELKGTYTVAPGGDPAAIRWRYNGAANMTVDAGGNLQASVGAGTITEHAPSAWQEIGGKRVHVQSSYTVSNDGVVGFGLGAYDHARPLVIDPALSYSTYLGGSGGDSANDVAADAGGSTYVVGLTVSANFPLRNAYQGSNAGATDLFISKFNPDGTLAFSTYLGGGGDDYGYGIAIDASGASYVTGRTQSTNFPVQNAYAPTARGNLDAFISKLSADGQTLLYSSYLGGSGMDVGWGVAADDNGNAYVSGSTASTNFPVRNAFQQAFAGGESDAFVTRIATTLSGYASLIYSSYLGGSLRDYSGGSGISALGHGVAADAAGRVYVAGATNSDNFPTLNAFQGARINDFDAFAAKIDTSLSGAGSLLYSTYLGGNNFDAGRDIALDAAGNAYVAGDESFSNFPLRNAYGQCGAGPFVAKFNMSLAGDASLVYSTCFGATVNGSAVALTVTGSGNATMAGHSASNSWPLVNPIMGFSGGRDVILAKLSATGNSLIYSTYLGGAGNDFGYGVASATVGGDAHTYVVGSTNSANYPTLNAFQGALSGLSDGFVSDINEPAPPPSPTPTDTPVPTATVETTPTPTSCPIQFTDVDSSNTFYTSIRCLACRGIISGYSDGTFRPNVQVTRGQLAKIVSNSAGFTDPVSGQTFEDVAPSNTFYLWIERLTTRGYMSGYVCGGPGEPCTTGRPYFRPFSNATRGQTAKIVSNAAGFTEPATGQTFEDVPEASTFYQFIQRLASRNVMGGYPCGGPGEPCVSGRPYFRPNNNVTRGQSAKIVANTFFPGCDPR